MQEFLKIAGIQAHLAWENSIENRAYFNDKIDRIHEDIDLIVLPEMFSTGFSMNPNLFAEESQKSDTLQWMITKAKDKKIAIAGSLMIAEGDAYYNRLYFVYPDGTYTFYNKRHTFTLAGEDKVYDKGNSQVIVNYKGWKLFLQVCYDLRFPVFSRNTMNYDCMLYVANWPKVRINAWDTLLKARAIENMSYCIGVNRVGLDGNGYEYNGHSAVYDALGAPIVLSQEREETFYSELSKDTLYKVRKQFNFLADRDAFNLSDLEV